MEITKGKKLENQTLDLRDNFYIEGCRFTNCKIILGIEFTYDLRNIVFENCTITPPIINLEWMNLNHPVIFKGTKVDIIGDLKGFFSNSLKKINVLNIGSAQISYIKTFFDGCTINGEEINNLSYDKKPIYIADEYWKAKYDELEKKR